MPLDNFTLLFSLALTSGLMAFSLALTSRQGQRDGLSLWAAALACETLAWMLAAMRETIPEIWSVVLANLFLSVAQAIKLAAVCKYRGIQWPRWQGILPVLAMMVVLVWLPVEDFRGRLIYGSLIYAVQFALLARSLHFDNAARSRAWWLIYGSTMAALPILALRGIFALESPGNLEPQLLSHSPNPMQVMVFVGMIMLNLLGALGFILLGKERAEREIRKLAMIDGLTGIFNRRAFMDCAEQALAGALRQRLPLALLMFDIDHFKQINDEYGHAAGDTVLVEISKLVARRLRKQDSFGRYGGEEFCILLPATQASGARELAEDLRKTIESAHLVIGESEVSVTISIGIGVCPAQCSNCQTDFSRMLSDADRALYKGKAEGRNRVILLPANCDNGSVPVPA